MTKAIHCWTLKGKKINLNNLKDYDIHIGEMAHAISNQCRYNGHTKKFYSVAEHSVLLVRYAQEQGWWVPLQKALLLHDCSEAFVGDVIHDLKNNLKVFQKLERKIQEKIFKRYNLKLDEHESQLTHFDRSICIDEMYQAMATIAPNLLKDYKPLHVTLNFWSPERAKQEFLDEAKRLEIR